MKMTNEMIVNGERVREATDYNVIKKLNDVDYMQFSVANNGVNRERFVLEKEVYVDLIKEWGMIIRRKVGSEKIVLTWAQRAWHLKRRIYNENALGEQQSSTARKEIEKIVKHVNNKHDGVKNDIPFELAVDFVGDVDVRVIGHLKYDSYLDAIKSICNLSGLNFVFNRNVMKFGRFENVIDVSNVKTIVDRLSSDQDLEKFANYFHVHYKKDGTDRIKAVNNVDGSNTKYRYDKVISNVRIINEEDFNSDIIKLEYENIRPIVNFDVRIDEFVRYRFNVGDILKIDLSLSNFNESGFYRIVKMDIGQASVGLSFEFSSDGQFSSRTFNPDDVLSYLGKKIRELELYR